MSLEEFENTPDSKTRRYMLMRSIMDYGMGVIYVGIGTLIMLAKQLNFRNEFAMSWPAKLLGGVAIIYGLFRIYRGYKKDYFKRDD
ncbi:MAG: hypothetical protein J5I50_05675 [Chitinophagaceae bacterium]|nr:hypothetical protein [Chitinophagaceae bacterium]